MDKEKKRKFHLVLYGIAIPVSLFALYTFIFVFAVYHKLGFVDLDIEQVSDGIRYTPMKYER